MVKLWMCIFLFKPSFTWRMCFMLQIVKEEWFNASIYMPLFPCERPDLLFIKASQLCPIWTLLIYFPYVVSVTLWICLSYALCTSVGYTTSTGIPEKNITFYRCLVFVSQKKSWAQLSPSPITIQSRSAHLIMS